MKNLLLVLCLTSLLLAAVRAVEPAPAIELKNKSTFDASRRARSFLADRLEEAGAENLELPARICRPAPSP